MLRGHIAWYQGHEGKRNEKPFHGTAREIHQELIRRERHMDCSCHPPRFTTQDGITCRLDGSQRYLVWQLTQSCCRRLALDGDEGAWIGSSRVFMATPEAVSTTECSG